MTSKKKLTAKVIFLFLTSLFSLMSCSYVGGNSFSEFTAFITNEGVLTNFIGSIAGYVWGLPSIIILVGTGIYLTFRFGFIQIKGFRHAIKVVSGKYDNKNDPGEVSHFRALSTALSATVGTGNIAGVATAITFGGPGAVFWMWVTALVGMASKFASCTLAIEYRDINAKTKEVSGGPMYTLKKGLKMPFIASLFALFTLIASFGIGNMVQANSIRNGLKMLVSPSILDGGMYNLIIGLILAVLVGLVIIGGVKRIAKVASYVVPIMSVVYCFAALLIIGFYIDKVPDALYTIVNHALNPWAFGWGMVGEAVRYGVARGVFSNEAGLGSAPMAHAVAKTKEPVREGLVAMLEPFIDTIIVCTMTALVIVITGVWGDGRPAELISSDLSAFAFSKGFSGIFAEDFSIIGAWVVGFGLVSFAYSTIIAWSYYGDRSAEFLFGKKAILPYRILYTILIVVGATIPVKLVWHLADIANMFMALPNILSIILLSGIVKKLKDKYFNK